MVEIKSITRSTETRTRGHEYKLCKGHNQSRRSSNRFSARVINPWNNLPNETVKKDSVNSFKSSLNNAWKRVDCKFSIEELWIYTYSHVLQIPELLIYVFKYEQYINFYHACARSFLSFNVKQRQEDLSLSLQVLIVYVLTTRRDITGKSQVNHIVAVSSQILIIALRTW